MFCSNLSSLSLSDYRRYSLVLMKPWIQATWLSARVTVSASTQLFFHRFNGFQEPAECSHVVRMNLLLSGVGCVFEMEVWLLVRVFICMLSCGCVSLLPWAPVRGPNRINGLIFVCVCAHVYVCVFFSVPVFVSVCVCVCVCVCVVKCVMLWGFQLNQT